MIPILIEYKPVLTIIPANRLSIPAFVCSSAVVKPESIPASILAGIAKKG